MEFVIKNIFPGINVHKSQNIQGALSNLLKTNRQQKSSTLISPISSHSSIFEQINVTHAWILVQCMYCVYFKNVNFFILPTFSIKISRNAQCRKLSSKDYRILSKIYSIITYKSTRKSYIYYSK